MSDNDAGSWWGNKFVLGLLGAGLTAIIATLTTPIGERIRDSIFPTSAVVSGFVKREGKPVPTVKVVLNDKTTVTTTYSGRFLFQDVSSGVHSIKIFAEGEQLLFYDQFFVKQGEKEKTLDLIQLDAMPVARSPEKAIAEETNPAFVVEQRQPDVTSVTPPPLGSSPDLYHSVNLTHSATLIPPEARRPEFGSNTHQFTIWVQGTDQDLSSIEKVTYYLHPTFNPSVVTRYSPADNFALAFTAWGQFELKAKVYFKDGQVKDLSRYLSF